MKNYKLLELLLEHRELGMKVESIPAVKAIYLQEPIKADDEMQEIVSTMQEIESTIMSELGLELDSYGNVYKESAKESEVERGYDTDSTEGRGAYRDGEPAYEQTSEVK